jgi:hypothetical protein
LEDGIAQGAVDIAELPVSENTGNPRMVKLPVVTDTDRSEPTVAT